MATTNLISQKFNVLTHQIAIHSNKKHRQSIINEFPLYVHGLSNNRPHTIRSARFSKTIASEAAKKEARTCVMKCFSSELKQSQSRRSYERSTSSVVQKEAWAFLYISQIWGY
uniref:Uncharacterized protein n=1 Tax=Cucumis sativus TaxID=3659 RepID=A0A0A0KP12_CUCSA